MTGARTIENHIVPTIERAASDAQRPTPRVVAGFPVVLTNDEESARESIGKQLKVYGQLSSYRAMLDREGVAGPQDLALVGEENALSRKLKRVKGAGTTDLIAVLVETRAGSSARTLDFLNNLLRLNHRSSLSEHVTDTTGE